jgi:hypothetical protein
VGDNRSDRSGKSSSRGYVRNRRYNRAAAPQPGHRPPQGEAGGKRVRPVWFVVIMDVLILGVALNVYAISIRAFRPVVTGEALPTRTPIVSTKANSSPTPTAAVATTQLANNSEIASPNPSPTDISVDQGMWGANFPDKFTGGDVQTADFDNGTGTGFYRSNNMDITVRRETVNKAVYYVADIYVKNLENFKTAMVKDKFAGGILPVLTQAKDKKAILAVNGDDCGNNLRGYIVRNGTQWLHTPYDDVLVMNNNGSMKTFTNGEFDYNAIKQSGAWQIWSFGPMLLDGNGQPMTKFNTVLNGANPRTVIGYFEPGHYCLVVVDGRQPGYSTGLTTTELSQLMFNLGCKAAYNLDGGQSTAMVFNGKVIDKPYNNGRSVSDIVYVGETN